MSAPFLANIDWQKPWLAPLQPVAVSILSALDILDAPDVRAVLNAAASAQALQNRRGLPIRFVPQSELPVGVAYEAFIHETGCVPTRDNQHDFFNALVWLSFPQVKAQLNALQAAEIVRAETSASVVDDALIRPASPVSSRGKLRDAATIFDENAALLIVRDTDLLDALRNHRWHEAFMERRTVFGAQCEVRLFGHALMEKLVHPYKAITAHAWPLAADETFFSMNEHEKLGWIDHHLARQLQGGLATSDFTPLPVLGVPGWWDGQDGAFYGDKAVFRPKRAVLG